VKRDTQQPGLIQRYREEWQTRHYGRRTVDTDEQWLRRYLRFQFAPEALDLAVAHLDAQQLAAAVGIDAHGDDDGP
jgi:hypothetical protein